MRTNTPLTKRAFLRKATATAGIAAGVGLASDPAAAGCLLTTVTTDETTDTQCFTEKEDGYYTYAEVQLSIDGSPSTEWDFMVNNQSSSSGLCESPWDHHKTVTSDSETIGISGPEAYYGITVDKNGDDPTYDLELYTCS